ncbi:GNAT family N-acetyltransferase [uncultured Bosea sp.]|uniref:GNAT family N-acetyltransferase n=1 Tax=uncultured Bosea sp. TaxID=211457 RepID=UPI0025DCB87A|nr:GNAT family N-acetyltransferase [uncultured Bosea sp.]
MNGTSVPRRQIVTDRLVLRPTRLADAERAFAIQSDWEVARMLRMAIFPPEREGMRAWFSDHAREWAEGSVYRFAVVAGGLMIGVVDIDEISGRQGELGYWFDRAAWGRAYAFEAAQTAVDFAFRTIGLTRLRSGHAADNAASGKILAKLGFRSIGTALVMSHSRGEEIRQCSLELVAPVRF